MTGSNFFADCYTDNPTVLEAIRRLEAKNLDAILGTATESDEGDAVRAPIAGGYSSRTGRSSVIDCYAEGRYVGSVSANEIRTVSVFTRNADRKVETRVEFGIYMDADQINPAAPVTDAGFRQLIGFKVR